MQKSLRQSIIKFDDFGNKKDLPCDAAFGKGALHALVDETLMGGVLIDNDNAVFGLGDDIGLMELAPRSTKREVRQGRVGSRERPRVGAAGQAAKTLHEALRGSACLCTS